MMSDARLHRRALLALTLCAILWSTGGFFIKSIPLDALTIAGARSAIAALVIFLWNRRVAPTWSKAQIGSIVSYALTVILFVSATKLTTAANAIFLQYTAPVWVAILSWAIARERVTRSDVASVVAVLIAMSVFFIDSLEGGTVVGDVVAVASGVAFAGVALFMRAQHGVSTMESILFGNILTALVCLPFFTPFIGEPSVMINLVLLGVVQLGVSYILYAWAMKYVTALEAVLITVIEPLLNPIWVGIGHGEVPSQTAILGGLIVVGAVMTRNLLHAKRIQRTADH